MTIQGPESPEARARPDDRQRQASDRSNCYGLLALTLRDELTPEAVAQLRSPPLADALGRFGCDAATDLAGELDVVTERLREEYTRVFVGPGPHVPPYASVHRDGEGQLWGDSTVQVKRFIEATGLSFEGNWDSIPDHVAVEFELMQRLTAHEAELWARTASAPAAEAKDVSERLRQCLRAQEAFLRDHLSAWVPRFCGGVLETSAGAFYRAMAGLARSIVLSDVEELSAAPSAL